MKPRIVVVGSLNMDLVVRSPRLPRTGETVLGAGDLQTIAGGKGSNQAYAAAKLGAEVTLVGRVGDDEFGEELIQVLHSADVKTKLISRDATSPTGIALIVVDHSGRNMIVVSSGANGCVSPDDVIAAEGAISVADLLLLQLEIPIAAVAEAARLANRHGVTTVLNPAPAQTLPPELLPCIDYLIPNETELSLLSGYETDSGTGIEQAAELIEQSGVKNLILTMGSRGAFLKSEDALLHFPAFPIAPVDTTAAGDAFVASFSVALAEGKSPQEAIRYGNAAGALACKKFGAQPSMPDRSELEHFLRMK